MTSKKTMDFSVLSYTPSKLSGERINIGVLCADCNGEKAVFSPIKKYSRLRHFDDELDIKMVSEMLCSISRDVKIRSEKGNFIIKDFIKFYINNFSFSKPLSIQYEDFDKKTSELIGAYLRFDLEKSERPSKLSDQKLLLDLLKSQNVSVSRRVLKNGSCNEKISYDLETDEYYVKFFDFENRDLSKSIHSAKSWAWNGMHSDKDLIIVYRYDSEDLLHMKEFDSIMDIFKKSNVRTCDVLNLNSIFSKKTVS